VLFIFVGQVKSSKYTPTYKKRKENIKCARAAGAGLKCLSSSGPKSSWAEETTTPLRSVHRPFTKLVAAPWALKCLKIRSRAGSSAPCPTRTEVCDESKANYRNKEASFFFHKLQPGACAKRLLFCTGTCEKVTCKGFSAAMRVDCATQTCVPTNAPRQAAGIKPENRASGALH
jgi:hypothetical protein